MKSSTYPDSSFLFSLVCKDSNSTAANIYMELTAEPLIFTPMHRIEARNALRNSVARGLITESDKRAAFRQLDVDLRNGLLVHTPIDWTNVFRRADDLSDQHASTDGQRTIDLLHVAFAIECGAQLFLSFDNRQRSLARAAGLKVNP